MHLDQLTGIVALPSQGYSVAETDADRFRRKAADCREMAEEAVSAHDRETWLKLAVEWLKLAAEVENRHGKK
jgi:hypothetical protein